MIHHITYSDLRMTESAKLASESARKFGMQSTICCPQHIDGDFWAINKDIFTKDRGAGYWLWKPYIIYRELSEGIYDDSDWILYTDAGVEIINNPSVLLSLKEDIVLFGNNYPHDHWCKPSVNISINKAVMLMGLQVQASAMLFRVTEENIKFVYEWLLWCQIPGMIDDSDDGLKKIEGYQEHRHDQAILTCLACKYQIPRHWWPAVYNNGAFTYDKSFYEDDKYPALFHHHRKRNDEW
jgi:hypothetical protein